MQLLEKSINIISFNIPYPPNYGGVIDIFFKLKVLHESGIKIILHTFEYGRKHSKVLNQYCSEVYYYKRNTGIASQLSILPYIVYSRRNNGLLHNLLKNNFPILFEGIHTTYYIDQPELKNRLKIVRAHNIEHIYYQGLSEQTKKAFLKTYLKIEAKRLKYFERKLQYSDYILPLSTTEFDYFKQLHGDKSILVPLFHPHEQVNIQSKTKPYVLYHGDLSTPENIHTALFIINQLAPKVKNISWVIAGLNPNPSIYDAAKGLPNISIGANPDEEHLQKLIQEAAVNFMYSNQISGVKLKLLNALYNGHYCLANEKILIGSGLDSLCVRIPENIDEILNNIRQYIQLDFPDTEINKRKELLYKMYDNRENVKKIITLLP